MKHEPGWTEDRKTFVLVDGVIGDAATKIIGVNRANSVNDPSGRLSNSGSWKSWRDTVAEPARRSTILMFGICVALAAPLLAIINRQSFTICLFGRSRVGKSIATLLGASVIGMARIDDLITWNITDARLEQRISEFNDALFPIDDLSLCGAPTRKSISASASCIQNKQGWSTARHSSFTAAHEGAHHGWRSIVLTSSEKSVRDLAHAVKLERQHGEALRLIDVPESTMARIIFLIVFPRTWTRAISRLGKKTRSRRSRMRARKTMARHFESTSNLSSLIAPSSKNILKRKLPYFEQHVCDEFDGDVARDVAERSG